MVPLTDQAIALDLLNHRALDLAADVETDGGNGVVGHGLFLTAEDSVDRLQTVFYGGSFCLRFRCKTVQPLGAGRGPDGRRRYYCRTPESAGLVDDFGLNVVPLVLTMCAHGRILVLDWPS